MFSRESMAMSIGIVSIQACYHRSFPLKDLPYTVITEEESREESKSEKKIHMVKPAIWYSIIKVTYIKLTINNSNQIK